jgi:GxxExxY protein
MAHGTDDVDSVSEKVIGGGIRVHRAFGPGLLESVYHAAMIIEMRMENLQIETARRFNLTYRGQPLRTTLEVDLLVENCLAVEVKAVECIHPVHLAQVITYLKLTGCAAGLLPNFNATTLKAGMKRLDHPDLYVRKHRDLSI